MDEQPVYYQPPDNHENHIRVMAKALAWFFGVLAVLVTVFILNAHRILIHLPFEAEKNFVRPYEELAGNWFGDDKSDKHIEIETYLQNLADELGEAMELPEDIELNVHYVDSSIVNAFATLGGNIFVFDGLLEALPDENSLAMVMGHEVAHIKHRDPIVSLGRGVVLQILYSYVVGDYASTGDMLTIGSEVGLLYFGREQETAADEAAISALQNHYGHVAGYSELFKLMIEMEDKAREDSDLPSWLSNQESSEWLSTHPELNGRIEHLRALAGQNNWREGRPAELPEDIRLLLLTDKSKD